MPKNRTLQKLMRLLITLAGAGVGAALALAATPFVQELYPEDALYMLVGMYVCLGLVGGLAGFVCSKAIIHRTMKLISAVEGKWDAMPFTQIAFSAAGLVTGLIIAALVTQLILSAGASLITISFSALTYLMLGYVGLRIGYRRYRDGKGFLRFRRGDDEDEETAVEAAGVPCKLLDTSVIIDGRILDIVKTGFLEGTIVVPQFVLAELRHIADSGDSLRRARGRRGLDVLAKLQKEAQISVDETDYPDASEVDVKLLRLCRDMGGTVVTNDYNLNKVAGVTGIRVLNINDLSNAVKPMLLAGEELTVQIVREGKEPGQGVAYLDDGTMIVVENGRRFVGETVQAVVTTVLQTSAGRMIFTKLKTPDEKAG